MDCRRLVECARTFVRQHVHRPPARSASKSPPSSGCGRPAVATAPTAAGGFRRRAASASTAGPPTSRRCCAAAAPAGAVAPPSTYSPGHPANKQPPRHVMYTGPVQENIDKYRCI